jgi:hypothetical protein
MAVKYEEAPASLVGEVSHGPNLVRHWRYRRCFLKTADGTTKVVLPPLTWIEGSHSTLAESLFILAGIVRARRDISIQ